MNCTAPVNETISVYYNDSATPAMLIITSPRAEELTITIVRAEQLESNYTIGPNQNINSTRKAWFSIKIDTL